MPDGATRSARTAARIRLGGEELIADLSGALWWPSARTLAFADLHFEKGSAYAARGFLAPPYDTRATLARMLGVILRYRPERVICLGDSFHDMGAFERIGAADRRQLRAAVDGCDWVWITGNHDPDPPPDMGGRAAPELTAGPLLFRHEAEAQFRPGRAEMSDLFEGMPGFEPAPAMAEVSGHYHPKAAVRAQGRRVTRPCFIADGARLILPSFGAFTGGLNVLDPAIGRLFPGPFTTHLLGRERLHTFASTSGALEVR